MDPTSSTGTRKRLNSEPSAKPEKRSKMAYKFFRFPEVKNGDDIDIERLENFLNEKMGDGYAFVSFVQAGGLNPMILFKKVKC
jgi:hypothetical protein